MFKITERQFLGGVLNNLYLFRTEYEKRNQCRRVKRISQKRTNHRRVICNFFQMLESDMPDNEICAIINSIHLTEEVKQIIKQEIGEEGEILKK